MKYHRYTTVLFLQSKGQINITSIPERKKFSLHAFAQENSLVPSGIHFWRSEWTAEARPSITAVYRDILQKPEPLFVRE